MKRLMTYISAFAMLIGLSFTAWAADTTHTRQSKVKLSGFGYAMFTQLVKGEAQGYNDNLSHYWLNSAVVHLNISSDVSSWFTTNFALEMQMESPFEGANMTQVSSYYMQYKLAVPAAEGIFHWDYKDNTISSLKIESGLFPYTFNSEVKNLGNYLYRGQAKPLYVETRADYPWSDLMGVRAEMGLFDNKLKVEGLLTSQINHVPWFDISPGITVSYTPNKIIDVGVGATFAHAIQTFGGWLSDDKGKQWKATNIDSRVIFDPKPLLGDVSKIFGDEDGILYGEVAILGLKDSAEYSYIPKNTLLHRMPMLVGINVPCFKLLDVLAVELEYFKSPYANDWFGNYGSESATSKDLTGSDEQIDNYINRDNFKWSFYAKKAIGKFEVRAMVADDHTIYKLYQTDYLTSEQTMQKPGDWQWSLEFRYNL